MCQGRCELCAFFFFFSFLRAPAVSPGRLGLVQKGRAHLGGGGDGIRESSTVRAPLTGLGLPFSPTHPNPSLGAQAWALLSPPLPNPSPGGGAVAPAGSSGVAAAEK